MTYFFERMTNESVNACTGASLKIINLQSMNWKLFLMWKKEYHFNNFPNTFSGPVENIFTHIYCIDEEKVVLVNEYQHLVSTVLVVRGVTCQYTGTDMEISRPIKGSIRTQQCVYCFLSSCLNNNIGNNAAHLWRHKKSVSLSPSTNGP